VGDVKRLFWKDKDITIFTAKQLTKKEFFNLMMYIGSVTYGLTDEKILNAWLSDVRDKNG
jgi:hypothetical protein